MKLNKYIIVAAASFASLTAGAFTIGCPDTDLGDVVVEGFKAERAADRMAVSMNIILDNLTLKGSQQLVLTPVLFNNTDSLRLPSVYVDGREQYIQYQRGNDSAPTDADIVVRRLNGKSQSIDYAVAPAYEPWMANYTAVLLRNDCGCGQLIAQSEFGLGHSFTPYLAFITPPAVIKDITIEKEAHVDFIVDRTEIEYDYHNNHVEIDSIVNTINIVRRDPNITIRNINIHGYASPESPYAHNEYLASTRARSLKDFVRAMVQLDNDIFSSSYTPEDWDGLIRYLENSDLANAEAILAIARDNSIDPDSREWKIKSNYPEDYRYMLDNWYPYLRRSMYRILYRVRSFSVEEAKQLLDTKPQQLSLNEMYLVAKTYEPGSKEFNHVMDVAVLMHPDDEIANLNAALSRLAADEAAEASRFIDKAGDSAEADNARGIIAWLNGDYIGARGYWTRAAEAGLPAAQLNLEASATAGCTPD